MIFWDILEYIYFVLLVSLCLINLAFYVGGVLFFSIYLNFFKSFVQYIILHSLFLNNKYI